MGARQSRNNENDEIGYARVSNIDGEFIALAPRAIETLNAQSRGIKFLLPEMSKLTALKTLDLSENHLIELSSALRSLTLVTRLSCAFNAIKDFAPAIVSMTNLASLDFSYNQVRQLPEDFGVLHKLVSLNLAGNKLSLVPESIARCTKLVALDLSNNRLCEIPDAIGELTQLVMLHLQHNQITTLVPLAALATSNKLEVLTLLAPEVEAANDNCFPLVRGVSLRNPHASARHVADIVAACIIANEDAMATDSESDCSGNESERFSCSCDDDDDDCDCRDGDDSDDGEKHKSKSRRLISADTCSVCMDEQTCVALMPCAHLCVCGDCAAALDKCPLCRGKIEQRIQIYRS